MNGQELGQYTIIDQIGHGGMAAVYRAKQHSVDREVAIKILPPSMTMIEGFQERFYREVDIISHLTHPHILPVHDFGEQDGLAYIVMPYITGGTLSGLIKQGPIDPGRTSTLMNQIASALDYAHGQGIMHRDMKPGNVLLDPQGNAYLADFGLAKVTDSQSGLTGTGMIGTPAYMAPELADPGSATATVDIYALAVMLFQMLTGKLPFETDSALGMMMAHTSKPVPSITEANPDLPGDLQVIIERGMAKSPADRYPTAGSIASDLSAVLTGKTQSEAPVGLVFTDSTGHVIFVDGFFLKMTHRSAGQARTLIGTPLHDLLGVQQSVTQALLNDIAKVGQVREVELTIQDSLGKEVSVFCSGTATYDERSKPIGADLSLRAAVEGTSGPISAPISVFDTGERQFLHEYVAAHINALRVLLIRMGGQKPADKLQQILNETAERNAWPIQMEASHLNVDDDVRSDVFRALLSKAIASTASMVGKQMVVKQMDAVDQQLGAQATELAEELNIREVLTGIK
jgi:serine/threonine protein kinase